MSNIKIASSILSADFTRLGEEVKAAEKAGTDWIHFDVMDGRFVPNISFGIPVLEAIRRITELPLDVHLMIVEPDRYLAAFAKAGADRVTVHVEACPHLHRTIQHVHELGLGAGVALNPATPLTSIEEVLGELDLVLIMTVNPGFGGQRFIASSLSKLRRLRQMLDATGVSAEVQVDGGINVETAPAVVQAGATVLVAGSAIFGAAVGVGSALRALRQAAITKTPELISVPAS